MGRGPHARRRDDDCRSGGVGAARRGWDYQREGDLRRTFRLRPVSRRYACGCRLPRANWPEPRSGTGKRFGGLHLVVHRRAAGVPRESRQTAGYNRSAQSRGKGRDHIQARRRSAVRRRRARAERAAGIHDHRRHRPIRCGLWGGDNRAITRWRRRHRDLDRDTRRAGPEFDLTAPTFRGAVPKTVRAAKGAKTARVTFKVTAVDAVDGAVPTACQPKSGSRFKVGKTTVRCSAMDSSANTAKTSFTVTVKRR